VIKTVAGTSCESGRVRHQPGREWWLVANAWWNYIVLIAKVSPDF
jgi:hypothetical protein